MRPVQGTLALTGGVVALTAVLALSGRALAPTGVVPATFPYGVSVVAAFAAGLLAILSPCSGAILPAFFGFALDAGRGRRMELTYVFWLGLSTVFVPIGFATSLLSVAFMDHRDLVFLFGGLVLLALGFATLLELGARLSSWTGRVAGRGQKWLAGQRSVTAKAYAMGLVFGFATSSCTAPILGALQTLALGSAADSLQAMALFFVFGLGIVAPMFGLAWAFDRARLRPARLRREVRLFGRAMPVSRLATAAVMFALGIAFIAFRGTLDLTEGYAQLGATELYDDLNGALVAGTSGLAGWVLLAAALALAALLVWRRRRTPNP